MRISHLKNTSRCINLIFLLICSFLIVLNYFLVMIDFQNGQKLIVFIFLILIPFVFFLNIKNYEELPTKFLIALLIIISLSEKTFDWDAMNIWFFHAKRIYVSGNFFEQMKNYFPSAHNDYPTILPSLQVSVNRYFIDLNYGDKTVLYPKEIFSARIASQANLMFIIFPLIFIISFLKGFYKKMFFVIFFLFITEKVLLSGSVDNIFGLYFVSLFLCIYKYFFTKNALEKKLYLFTSILLITILTLLKNEGLVLFLSLYFALCVSLFLLKLDVSIKKILLLLVAILPILFWKYMCIKNNIGSDLINKDLFNNFQRNFFNLRNHWLIFNGIFLNKSIILPLAIYFYIFFKNTDLNEKGNYFGIKLKKINKKIYLFSFLSIFVYLLIIYFVYLISPHSMDWHVSTSAYRIVLPVGLLLITVSLMANQDSKEDSSFK
jgi:hypothetical protein